ncbi:hypothetical protein HC931_05670 [Candidatus Gracilibacteria bacterium]|nr:hypothetical protein [Candidatus Gracilibacteria bacterium]NJM86448.1 hypothetical protein [Hydrococcus sp. RU_2_2]NJQ96795.1 hypothetical protein [Hydrococcus sp. CSU_1_8]
MNSNKNFMSAFRYFKAGLKPLARVSVWGPPSLIALIALLYWQYRSNPEWQSTSFDQPEGVEEAIGGDPNLIENTDIGLEMPLQSIARDAERQQQEQQSNLINPSNPGIPPSPLLGTQRNMEENASDPTLLGRSTKQKNESNNTSNSSQIFMPLLPGVKNPSLVIPGQTNTRRQNNLVDSSVQSPINGLVKPKPVTVVDNPLQDAMGQVFSNPAPTQTAPNTAPNTSNRELGNPTGTNQFEASERSPQANGGFSNPSAQPPVDTYQPFRNPAPIRQNNRSDLFQPISPANNPYTYINSPVQPNAPAQPPLQPAQTPYLNAPMSANQAPTGYINAPVQQAPQISPNQLNQPVDPVTAPEVQRAIEDFGSSP